MLGLLLSLRARAPALELPALFALHEHISWLALGFIVLHVGALLFDSYEPFSLVNILVPFTAHYRPLWTGLGVVTLYVTAMITASFHVRQRIGQRAWRLLHYGSFAVFAGATAHGVMAGNSTGESWMRWTYLLAGSAVLFLTVVRMAAGRLTSVPKRAMRAPGGRVIVPRRTPAPTVVAAHPREAERETWEAWRRPTYPPSPFARRGGGASPRDGYRHQPCPSQTVGRCYRYFCASQAPPSMRGKGDGGWYEEAGVRFPA